MNHTYEIEIKSLLGSQENAEKLKTAMQAKDPQFQVLGGHKQLNHYFVGGDLLKLQETLGSHIAQDKQAQFTDLVEHAKDFSVRTRWADGRVIFVIKASVDDTTSANGTARLEFESDITDLTLEQLDQLILEAGFDYQAKWSRERQDFKYKNANVSIDKNAGYGYLAEFELVADDAGQANQLKQQLRDMMADLAVVELPQDRLARMFDFYNTHWQDYYGTEKTFMIE
jgi:adenylate cyclase class IV